MGPTTPNTTSAGPGHTPVYQCRSGACLQYISIHSNPHLNTPPTHLGLAQPAAGLPGRHRSGSSCGTTGHSWNLQYSNKCTRAYAHIQALTKHALIPTLQIDKPVLFRHPQPQSEGLCSACMVLKRTLAPYNLGFSHAQVNSLPAQKANWMGALYCCCPGLSGAALRLRFIECSELTVLPTIPNRPV